MRGRARAFVKFTGNGVVLVDPGESPAIAKLLVDRVSKLTDDPSVAVFNSHVHGLYWHANTNIANRFRKGKRGPVKR